MGRRRKTGTIDLPYNINPTTGCHEYTGSLTDEGYGQININGQRWLVHRLMWTLKKGYITRDDKVRHTCDNPPCMNIKHLRVGTQADNIQDAVRRGRLKGRVSKAKGNWRGGRPRKAKG